MDVRSALKRQYHASLATLRQCIEKCPDAKWNDPADGGARFWRAAYHALFFTHFYAQQSPEVHKPWSRYERGCESFKDDDTVPAVSKQDMLEYWAFTDTQVDANVDRLDLDAAQCGFPWYKMPTLDHQIVNIRHTSTATRLGGWAKSTLDHQIVNIRHTQHHAAALATWLRRESGIDVDWIGG